MTKSLIDQIGRERADQMIEKAVTDAVDEAQARGLPEAVKIDGVWVKRYPDGRIEPIDGEASHADR
ncbi:hypothetical protein [Lysobacter sp. Root983]|uniref:hypothetical protein n=1 Tax=Lysobacter sp. Root983 TaxID=1736613 RepID=UPI00070F88D6|nr:hypothetical protein [Lysobacter sp. Root983]KRD74495.1 hypothetical protein ASE43_14725 [Lysobacter sp. Root983]